MNGKHFTVCVVVVVALTKLVKSPFARGNIIVSINTETCLKRNFDPLRINISRMLYIIILTFSL